MTCYGYGRHSTIKQDMTQDAQRSRCLAYWRDRLVDDGVEWGGWYYDASVSGGKPFSERERGRELFHLAQAGDHIVIAKLDRAFRRLSDGVNTLDQLADRGVYVHLLDIGVDTGTALGRFFQQILLAVAELERGFVSQRTKEVIAHKRKNGLPYGKACPIGWRTVKTPTGKQYRVDEEERELCDVMQGMIDAGSTTGDIAGWVGLQRQYPTKRSFATLNLVKWALRARELGYPKIASRKELNEQWRSRQVAFGDA